MSKSSADTIQNRIIDLSSDLYDYAETSDEPLMMVALAARLLMQITVAAASLQLTAEQRAEFQTLLRAVDMLAERSISAAEAADSLPDTEREPRVTALDPKLN